MYQNVGVCELPLEKFYKKVMVLYFACCMGKSMTSNSVVALRRVMKFGLFFIKHQQKHLAWSNKLEKYEKCSPVFMYR